MSSLLYAQELEIEIDQIVEQIFAQLSQQKAPQPTSQRKKAAAATPKKPNLRLVYSRTERP